jgi:hypothetical protein
MVLRKLFGTLNGVFGKLFWWRYCGIQRSDNFQTLYTVHTKHKHFGIKIYKHSEMTGYTCSMKFHLEKMHILQLMN